MPRFYAHFQVSSDLADDSTLIVDMPHTATIAQLSTECCRRYNALNSQESDLPLDPAVLQVVLMPCKDCLQPEHTLAQRVKNGADVVLSFPVAGDERRAEELSEPLKVAAETEAAPLQPGMQTYLQDCLESSTKAMKAKNFRCACEYHDKIFAIDPTNMQACYQQALVELSIGAFSSASETLERALTAVPPPQEPELYVKLGEAYDNQGGRANYQTALQHYDTGLGLASASAAYDDDRTDNIKMLMAKTLQKQGSEEIALHLVTSVLQRNEQHTEALALYAVMMTER